MADSADVGDEYSESFEDMPIQGLEEHAEAAAEHAEANAQHSELAAHQQQQQPLQPYHAWHDSLTALACFDSGCLLMGSCNLGIAF